MLDHVGDDHDIEFAARERKTALTHKMHVGSDKPADGADGFLGEVARSPGAPLLSQQQADDSVVRSEVQAALSLDVPERSDDRSHLVTLQRRLPEEAQGPGLRHDRTSQ